MTPDLSPLASWLGHPEFEALAVPAAQVPNDDAPRLVLADWLRDHGDETAADLVAGARGLFGGWLAILRYERQTGRSAAGDMPHLTTLFCWPSGHEPEAMDAARRAAAALILGRANGQQPVPLSPY